MRGPICQYNYTYPDNTHALRACLAQLNFTSKAVFLENSFMSDFLDEAELFWKKCLAK